MPSAPGSNPTGVVIGISLAPPSAGSKPVGLVNPGVAPVGLVSAGLVSAGLAPRRALAPGWCRARRVIRAGLASGPDW